MTDAQVDQLTEKIIGCGIEVHRELGPGLLESVYRECFGIELNNAQLHFETEQRIRLKYKGTLINSRLQIDLLVEGSVIVELKSVDSIHPIHLAQGVTYLKLTNCPAGVDPELQRHFAQNRNPTADASRPLSWRASPDSVARGAAEWISKSDTKGRAWSSRFVPIVFDLLIS